MIVFNGEQKEAIRRGEAVKVSDPELGKELVVLPVEAFDEICEILEDERVQRGFRQAGLKSAQRWLKDNPF